MTFFKIFLKPFKIAKSLTKSEGGKRDRFVFVNKKIEFRQVERAFVYIL